MITIDELDEKHARAALDVLEADGAWPVFTGKVPDQTPPPYVMAYPTVEWPIGEGQTLEGKTSTCITRWYFHCVGPSDADARAVAGRVRQLLANFRPTISGRSCGLIQQEASLPPVRDETTGVLVMDVASIYVLYTFAG